MRPVSEGWTPARVELLTTMWANGSSATEIAVVLGDVSREAVCGKVHRLKLGRLHRAARPTPKPRPAPAKLTGAPSLPRAMSNPLGAKGIAGVKANAAARTDFAPTLAQQNEPSGSATVLTLGAHMCRWPIGDPSSPSFTFCGKRKERGSYCAAHAKRAYQPAAPGWERDSARFSRSRRRYV